MSVELYAVVDQPDDPANVLLASVEDARLDAAESSRCVVAYIFEFSETELVHDYRPQPEEDDSA